MRRITIDFLVGVFVLIGFAAIAFLTIQVANHSGMMSNNYKSYTLYANFNNIGSLNISAPVKVSGFNVGRVSNITLNQKTYQAQVTLQINDNYKFSSDSSAQILTTGLLGEQYIGLQSGADSEYLKDGDTISITSSALVLEDLIGKFMTNMSNK